MRKLPIYLVLDTSGSMSGEPIASLQEGVEVLVSTLRRDPYALETVWLSIITFASEARQIVPLTDLVSFQMPEFRASGQTAMGKALELTALSADREVSKSSSTQKGDWKPLVFIMTDGGPNDLWDPEEKRGFADMYFQKGLEAFQKRDWGLIVGCAIGLQASKRSLKKITPHVIEIFLPEAKQFQAFFKWVSTSISASVQIEEAVNDLDALPKIPSELGRVEGRDERVETRE